MVPLTSRHDITLDTFRRVAWEGETVTITDESSARMVAARRAFDALLASDPEISVYGVTTGGGEFAKERVVPAQSVAEAVGSDEAGTEAAGGTGAPRRREGFDLSLAFGDALPERVTRGIVLARLANFLGGHAVVSPRVAEAVAGMLDGRPLPPVPARAQGGSGEIIPLGHLLASVLPLTPGGMAKESNGLLNGSPCAAALVADAALAARRRLALAADVLALSCEAIAAPFDNYGEALDDLWGDADESEALAAIRTRLEGGSPTRRAFQTPVSWRIIPRILGQAHRATAQAERAATTSLSSVSDNPVFVPPDPDDPDPSHPFGQTFSTGGYHNAMAPPALDALAAAWADLCLLCERHTTHLLDGSVSLLPDKLRAGEGWTYYLVFIEMGIGEEARRAASQRTFLPPSSGGFAQSDIAAPSFFAYHAHQETSVWLDAALAVLAAIASQALFVVDRPAPPRLVGFLEEVRRHFPPVVDPRPLGVDVDALRHAFTTRVYDLPATSETG